MFSYFIFVGIKDVLHRCQVKPIVIERRLVLIFADELVYYFLDFRAGL